MDPAQPTTVIETVSNNKYTADDLAKAIEGIKNGSLSFRGAQKKFNVPKSTLFEKVKGNITNKLRLGPTSTLSKEEESSIADWAIKCSVRGQPRTPLDIRLAAKSIIEKFPRKNLFKDNLPSYNWYLSFLRRNPSLKVRKPEALSSSSANVSEENLRGWWTNIDQYLTKNNLKHILNFPERIGNCDETMFEFNPKPGKVLVENNSKNSYMSQMSGNKTGCTVLHTVLADGSFLDPFVIFPYLRLPDNIKNVMSELQDIDFNYNASGWMTEQNFLYYIEFVFVKAMKKRNVEFPVLLFLDNHSSHISLNVSKLCDELGVILITLYPNSTHVLQPLDCAVFRGLKAHWTNLLIKKRGANGNFKVTMINFPQLLLELLNTSHNADAVRNGFKVCGIYEWNVDNIDFSKLLTAKTRKKKVQRSEVVVMSDVSTLNPIIESPDSSRVTNNENSSVGVSSILEIPNNASQIISQEEIIAELNLADLNNASDSFEVDLFSNNFMELGTNYNFIDRTSSSVNESFYNQRTEEIFEDSTRNSDSFDIVPQSSPPDGFTNNSVANHRIILSPVESVSNLIEYNEPLHRVTIQNITNADQPPIYEFDTPVQYQPLDLSFKESATEDMNSIIRSAPHNKREEPINRDAILTELKEIYGATKFKQFSNAEYDPKDVNEDILMRILQKYRPVTDAKDLLILPPTNKRLGVKNVKRQPYVISSPDFRQFRSKIEKEKFEKKLKETQNKENKKNERNKIIEEKALLDLERTKQTALARAEKQIATAKRKAEEKLIKLNKKKTKQEK